MGKKVLLIEDEESIAQLYKIVFSRRNYEITLAGDGEEGMKKAIEIHPDIILVDIMMPKMNGLQVTQRVKSHEVLSKTPMFALSNLTDVSTEKAMLDAGVAKFVVKSDHLPDQIVDMVDEFFSQQ